MKKYSVCIPVAGYVYKEVEANSADEAIDIAFDEGYEDNEVCELDMYEKLVEGNVCRAYYNEAFAELIED